ncbi:MAG TPA: gamma-glutamyl-gamma-aminobutyrate hydrolase family protein [Gemmatimonadales bacterium]|nr:gamma-glutamyl-gamma-aminobutyrate hydrolase family protein [Gemmatimonadales bacterium]
MSPAIEPTPPATPRIGVTGVVRRVDGADRSGVNAAYLRAVLSAGGLPFVLSPLLGPELAPAALGGLHGLLLTGGEDLDPAWYGATPSPRLGPVDRARDAFELAIFAEARRRGLPVLAICRGLQLVNVALGGTLWQDLPSERPGRPHDAAAPRTARVHRVRIRPGSRAARALGAAELVTNSFHHQAVRDLAPPLEATAFAEDGVIEAVEERDGGPWLLAVQWHPEEFHADPAAPDGGLFAALVEEARRAAALNAPRDPAASDPDRSSRGTTRGRSRR